MVELALALLTGVAIGGALAWLTGTGQRRRLEEEIARRSAAEARLQALEQDRHMLTQEINAMAATTLRDSQASSASRGTRCHPLTVLDQTPRALTAPELIMDKPRLAATAEA